ncbi:MAG: glycoside hydrolase family 97 N-terminal domain-containing protein [bacterium]
MCSSTHISLLSPDRRVEVRFAPGEWCAEGQRWTDAPLWQVWFAGRLMLRPSWPGLAGAWDVAGVVRHRCRQSWQPAAGDAATLADHHNELVVRLRARATPDLRRDLIFRCSNQGAAMRICVPRQRGLAQVTPTGEGAVFRFPPGTQGWVATGRTADLSERFKPVALEKWTATCETPLMLNFAHGKLACLLQAGFEPLRLQPTRDGLAVSTGATPEKVKTPYASPWLVLLLADTPCDLPGNSGLLLNLTRGDACSQRVAGEAEPGCAPPFPCYPFWLSASPDAADRNATPAQRAACELIRGTGVVRWDETRFLRGELGSFIVAARRLGDLWQVGGMTGAEGRVLTVRLAEILRNPSDPPDPPDRPYALTILRDPLPGETTDEGFVRETFHGVDVHDKPRLELLPHGGFVLRLEPERAQ